MHHLITGFLLLAIATLAQAAGNNNLKPPAPPVIVPITKDPVILFFESPVVVAAGFSFMVLAVLGCGLAKKRPGAFDLPLEGSACGCCGTSSMAQIRRLCIAVAYFSMNSWFSTFAVPLLLPVYVLSLGTFLLSLRLCYAAWQSNFIDSSTWVATPTYNNIFRMSGVIYIVAMIIAVLEVSGMTAEIECNTQKYSTVNCNSTKAFYVDLTWGAIFNMSVLAGLTVALAHALEDFAVRVQQATNGRGVDLEASFNLPPLAQVYQAASSNAPPVHMPTATGAKQQPLLARETLQI